MNYLAFALVVLAALPCKAQTLCAPAQLPAAASRVHRVQQDLKKIGDRDMNADVPVAARDLITELKDALSCVADATLAGAGPVIDTATLQTTLAKVLRANPPEPGDGAVIAKDDHRYDEAFGSYGHNLRVTVTRPPGVADIAAVEFSIKVECGDDHLLLVYGRRSGVWSRQLRWQAPPLKQISDAFGDFFLVAALSRAGAGSHGLRVVVAHGTPWCTSRFSEFDIDVLSPSSDPNSPTVLWHTSRGYSRGGSRPLLRASGNTFELRLHSSTMDISEFERPVIYHYQIDEHDGVRRIQPVGSNARGFVEEWLSMPWSEARGFVAQETGTSLQAVHDQFDAPRALGGDEFIAHAYGPVRACKAPGMFQVQIDSTLNRTTGRPGGESRAFPTLYFRVRDTGDGYVLVTAPTQPDPTCAGPDLMGPIRTTGILREVARERASEVAPKWHEREHGSSAPSSKTA